MVSINNESIDDICNRFNIVPTFLMKLKFMCNNYNENDFIKFLSETDRSKDYEIFKILIFDPDCNHEMIQTFILHTNFDVNNFNYEENPMYFYGNCLNIIKTIFNNGYDIHTDPGKLIAKILENQDRTNIIVELLERGYKDIDALTYVVAHIIRRTEIDNFKKILSHGILPKSSDFSYLKIYNGDCEDDIYYLLNYAFENNLAENLNYLSLIESSIRLGFNSVIELFTRNNITMDRIIELNNRNNRTNQNSVDILISKFHFDEKTAKIFAMTMSRD